MDNSEYIDIYREQADRYQQLVTREDYQGNILPALREICDLHGRIVVELGAGTGRLTKLLAPLVDTIVGLDNSRAMLQVARQELPSDAPDNWMLAAADHRHLPLDLASCDLVISGWSLCYLALDQGQGWEDGLRRVFRRLRQMLRPGGTFIILETMGTGYSDPNPPPILHDYFSFLRQVGMESKWIRTDYSFESVDEAVDLVTFFFGKELGEQVGAAGSPLLPECTGIWWTNDVNALDLGSDA